MRPFIYHAPTTISEAVELLASAAGEARPLAGGTDLLVQMRRGDRRATGIIDVKRIPELRELRIDGRGLGLGAAVTCAELCEKREVVAAYPGLLDAVSLIGGTAVQGRATVGGNLCNAAPSADTVPALIVLDAACVVSGPRGAREVKASEFCVAPGRTLLANDELLLSLTIPPVVPRSGAAYVRFIPRGEMDIAIVGVGVWVRLERETIAEARVALASVAPTPLLVLPAGDYLVGRKPTQESFTEAGRLAAHASRPISDHRGSAAQRRHLVGVLTRRCLAIAVDRAKRGANV